MALEGQIKSTTFEHEVEILHEVADTVLKVFRILYSREPQDLVNDVVRFDKGLERVRGRCAHILAANDDASTVNQRSVILAFQLFVVIANL